jgi:pimeloyl-ACP methyl ester carboxylesterase
VCQPFTTEAYRYIKLHDGRRLGYVECGQPAGQPVFYFHSFRFCEFGVLPHQNAKRLGIRLIAPDRPGFGMSDFKPNRTIADWANDIAELAHVLHLDKFGVLGHSGGGPFAVACAYKLPERVTKAALVSSVGILPDDPKELLKLLPFSYLLGRRLISWAVYGYLRFSGRLGYSPRVLAMAGEPGLAFFAAPPELVQFVTGLGDKPSRGRRYGAAWELDLYLRPWGFRLQEVKGKVELWHGQADNVTPLPVMQQMAEAMPNCQPYFISNENHFTLVKKYMDEVLKSLTV